MGPDEQPLHTFPLPGGKPWRWAAIVAAGGSPFDIGSDYGGSLRFPAHCCGVATIKPTSGRVPRTGQILPFGGLLDSFQQIGPIARCVGDLQLLLPIISGPDGVDPSIVPMVFNGGGQFDLSELRIAFHIDNGVIPVSGETIDIILCPVNANPALPHGSIGDELRAFSYTSAYNLTGWPAAVIPGGLSSKGLPIGIQIIGKSWEDDLVLALAACLEKALGGFQPPGFNKNMSGAINE